MKRFANGVFVMLGALLVLASACNPTSGKQPVGDDWTLEDLGASHGVSIRIPGFEVPAGHEEQSCYFTRMPDINGGNDYWVDRVAMAMNLGSHHMSVFRVRTIVDLNPSDGEPVKLGNLDATVVRGHDDYQHSPCWGSANWADWPLVANTENPRPPEWRLPDDVAMRFTPGEMIMVQTHYVNSSTQPTPSGQGRVGINFYKSAFDHPQELGTLFATQQNIRICQSRPDPVFSGTCKLPGSVTLTAANGHFHSRGRRFDMFTWDGVSVDHPADAARFYRSDSWDDPPMTVGIDRHVESGGGIWWDCAYEWREPVYSGCDAVNAKDEEMQNDCCYTFGGNTDVGEHCNVFLYYYPKLSSSDVFCN